MIDEFVYLESLNENRIELGLNRIKRVLSILGDIQDKLKIIHIAGTNGKGSVSNLINNILIDNCLDTKNIGLFTSPHLTKINERIKINNQEISDDDFKKYINYFRILLDKNCIKLTYFEFLTVIAIKYFYDNGVDIAVFECGLGGRLDSTNVFEKPLVSVITNIDFDHMKYLGNTLPKILDEKMGIFKETVPIVSAIKQDELREIIQKKANDFGSKLFLLDRDFFLDTNFRSFQYHNLMIYGLELKIRGKHQYSNLAIVLMILNILKEKYGYKFKTFSDIKRTINNFEFNGRLEFIRFDENKVGTNFILDVGHNLAGIKACADYLKSVKKDYKNLVIVFGMLKDKNYAGCVSEILKVGDSFYLTSPKSKRALETNKILKEFAGHNEEKKVKLASENYHEILKDISENFGDKDLVCVVGSFYLISDFCRDDQFGRLS